MDALISIVIISVGIMVLLVIASFYRRGLKLLTKMAPSTTIIFNPTANSIKPAPSQEVQDYTPTPVEVITTSPEVHIPTPDSSEQATLSPTTEASQIETRQEVPSEVKIEAPVEADVVVTPSTSIEKTVKEQVIEYPTIPTKSKKAVKRTRSNHKPITNRPKRTKQVSTSGST
jgi:hypothetical protein